MAAPTKDPPPPSANVPVPDFTDQAYAQSAAAATRPQAQPQIPAPPEVLESRTDPGSGILLGPSTLQPGDTQEKPSPVAPISNIIDSLLGQPGRLESTLKKLQPDQDGQKESTPAKIPGLVLDEPKTDDKKPAQIPGLVLDEPKAAAPAQIPGLVLDEPTRPEPPAVSAPNISPLPPANLPQSAQPTGPVNVSGAPTGTPDQPWGAPLDPQHQIRALLDSDPSLSPGAAQAIIAGRKPATISGDKPAPPKTVAAPTPPTPSDSDEAIRAQNEQALAHPQASASDQAIRAQNEQALANPPKPPAPVTTLKADDKNRVDPVALYSYLLGKFSHSSLVHYVPPDGERWGIKTGSAAEWAAFGLAVAKQESDLNALSSNDTDPGGSVGLFQFGQGQTQFTKGADQNNPQASADAFVRSVEHYLANKGSVANMGETFGSILRPNEAGQYLAGAQKVAAGGSGKDLVSSGGGSGTASSGKSSNKPAPSPEISLPSSGPGSAPLGYSGGGSRSGGGGGGGGGIGGQRGGGASSAGDVSVYPSSGGSESRSGGGGGGQEAAAGGGAPPRYQPQQMSVDTSQTDPMISALVNRGFSPQQAVNYAQSLQNIASSKGVSPLNAKSLPPPAAPSALPASQSIQLSLSSKQPITPKLLSAKQLMPSFKVTKAAPAAPGAQAKAPLQLNAPPAAPSAPAKAPQQAQAPPPAKTPVVQVTPAQQAPARQPQAAQAPPPPAPPPKDQPKPKTQPVEEPTEFTGGRPAGSTHGNPNPPGIETLTGALKDHGKQHKALLSPDDPRVSKQSDGYIKGEHFVEGDPYHENLLGGLPYGKDGPQREKLGKGETAIADKTPMHISYISSPKEAEQFPTRESRTTQYEKSSPEARLMKATEGALVGHSMIPLSAGIKLPTPKEEKAGETHQGYLQGISTNVMANNFQHINDKLEAMGRKTPYPKLGAKFANDLEGYYHNLLAGHTATGRGYAIGTDDHPNTPDRSHVPYQLTRKEADFIGAVVNNTAAFAGHDDAKKIRELARANGTLITEKGETNRLLHDIEQADPGWSGRGTTGHGRVLEPSIKTFKTGLIHEIHPTEQHLPETIRPGKEYQMLTKALARTSERGRPDIAIGASLHHTFQDNKKINEIERDFSKDLITEEEARSRLKALGEDPDDYKFEKGSGGLVSPYEPDPEAISQEEHNSMHDNLRKQWVGGKLGIEDYRRKTAEIPLPTRPSKPAASSKEKDEPEITPSSSEPDAPFHSKPSRVSPRLSAPIPADPSQGPSKSAPSPEPLAAGPVEAPEAPPVPKPKAPAPPKPPKPKAPPTPEPEDTEAPEPEKPQTPPVAAPPKKAPAPDEPLPAKPEEKPTETPTHTFKEVKPEEFIQHRNKSAKPEFLSDLKPEDIQKHKLFTNQDNTIGAAVSPEGDIQNVFNNGGEKGGGGHAVAHAIEQHGGRTLDAYDGFLPKYYRQFGFHETGRTKFNPEYAPKWDTAKHGTPDVVHMGWGGHPEGGPAASVTRAKNRDQTKWIPNERSTHYDDDFDAQKARSQAFARGAKTDRPDGAPGKAKAVPTGKAALPGSGAAPGRAVAPPAYGEPLPKVKADKPAGVKPPVASGPVEKPSWKTANEKARQAYLKKRVAYDMERQYKGADAHQIEVDRNDDKSIKYDPSGNPIYKKIDYDLANSPLLKQKGLKQIKNTDKHEDTLGNLIGPDGKEVIDPETGKPVLKHKHLIDVERSRLSAMHAASAVKTMGDKIVDEYMKIKDIPEIAAGEGWYSRMRTKLAAALGEHHELFAQLLGATSAKTPVRNNFIQSLDALEQYKSGKFDNHIKKYLEGYEKMREGKGALVAHMKKLGIPLVDKDGNKVETHEKDAAAMANWIHHHGILPRQQIQPGQEEGSKYNANSIAVLKALAGTWLKEVGAPKTPNFAGNLTGRTLEATIDVWAARFLKRLGYEGHGDGPWRSQGKSEPGVNSLDFAFSQDAMRHAADEITRRTGKKMNPDDLQAIAWFAEKHHWEKQGWTRGAGAEKSSFDDVADLAFPKTGEAMTSDDLRKHYGAIQAEQKRVKARLKTARNYVGHADPKMRAKLEPYMAQHGLTHEQVHGPEVEEEDEDEAA